MTDIILPNLDDLADWPELSYALGLTDGLPVHPPLRATVDALVAGTGRAPNEVGGRIPPRDGTATIEVIAANAAMAGARPEYMPVIIGALEAMLTPRFNLRGVQVTTHGSWPLVIVSGDAVRQLGMAHAESVFSGGGSRANAAIGRAIRLVLWNVGGSLPGEPVKEVFGQPGRYSFCIAESPNSPWEPLHRARGVDAPSAVTVVAAEAPHSVAMWGANDAPHDRLEWCADVMRTKGNNNTHTMGDVVVCVSPSEARGLAANGLSRADVQQGLFEIARRRIDDLRPAGPMRPNNEPQHHYTWWPDWVDQTRDDTLVPCVERPEDIHVVVCGADSIPWWAVCPGWGHLGGFAETRPVEIAGAFQIRDPK
ncbi:MAG TPA: hypothetical protein VM282_03625 [Acidimicrobiales bacterium]|nr:hypothetical protein [Acidimicrobiales bacterium]